MYNAATWPTHLRKNKAKEKSIEQNKIGQNIITYHCRIYYFDPCYLIIFIVFLWGGGGGVGEEEKNFFVSECARSLHLTILKMKGRGLYDFSFPILLGKKPLPLKFSQQETKLYFCKTHVEFPRKLIIAYLFLRRQYVKLNF